MKDLKVRAGLVALVILLGIVYLIPTLSPSLPPWWKGILPRDRIHLGLDLQGGMHLILEVEAQKAVESTAERLVQELKEILRTEKIGFRKIERQKDTEIEIQLASADQQEALRKVMEKEFPLLEWGGSSVTAEGAQARLTIKEREAEQIRTLAVDQALETIRNRVDQFGVSEPDIRPQGENRILIQLPGVQDPQRAKDLIGKTALLEFKIVDEAVSVEDAKGNKLPSGSKLYPMRRFDPATGTTSESQIVLKDRALMTGEYIANAQVSIDSQYNQPYVSLEFSPQGARIFERVTEENVKK